MMNAFRFVSVIGFALLTLSGCAQKQPKVTISNSPTPAITPTPTFSPSPKDLKEAGKYRQLGLQYRHQGRYNEAIKVLSDGVKLDPNNLSGRVLLGWTLHLAQQEQAASDALRQTLTLDPNYVPALNALGIVYLVSGDLQAAVTTHTQAAKLKSNNEIAYYNLCLAYHRLKEYEKAIANGKQAASLEPNNPHPWVALAIAYWDKGDKVMAQQAYYKTVALDSRYRTQAFLTELKQAGFSQPQIQVTKQVLKY